MRQYNCEISATIHHKNCYCKSGKSGEGEGKGRTQGRQLKDLRKEQFLSFCIHVLQNRAIPLENSEIAAFLAFPAFSMKKQAYC